MRLLITLFVALTAFVQADSAHARLCRVSEPTYVIAECRDGVCQKGFRVEPTIVGHRCRVRPVLNNNFDSIRHTVEQLLMKRWHASRLSGVFQFRAPYGCFENWRKFCDKNLEPRQISADISGRALQKKFEKWQEIERHAFRKHFTSDFFFWLKVITPIMLLTFVSARWIKRWNRIGWVRRGFISILIVLQCLMIAGLAFADFYAEVLNFNFGFWKNALVATGSLLAVGIIVQMSLFCRRVYSTLKSIDSG